MPVPAIVVRYSVKSALVLFSTWFEEGCYDAEDAGEKLAADEKRFSEEQRKIKIKEMTFA